MGEKVTKRVWLGPETLLLSESVQAAARLRLMQEANTFGLEGCVLTEVHQLADADLAMEFELIGHRADPVG